MDGDRVLDRGFHKLVFVVGANGDGAMGLARNLSAIDVFAYHR
jgi:hypothetical protein